MARRGCESWRNRTAWRAALATAALLAALVCGCVPTYVLHKPDCPLLQPGSYPGSTVDVWIWSDASSAGDLRAGRVQGTPDQYLHVHVGQTVVWHSQVGNVVIVDLKGNSAPFGATQLPMNAWGGRNDAVVGGVRGCFETGLIRGVSTTLAARSTSTASADSTKVPLPGPIVVVDY
jgi:hypothetical protein